MGNAADVAAGEDDSHESETTTTVFKGKGKGKRPAPPSSLGSNRSLKSMGSSMSMDSTNSKGHGKTSGGGLRRQWTIEYSEKPKEGTAVEVLSGPQRGRRGVVIKVSGEGSNTRWRVSFGDGGSSSWVDSVNRIIVSQVTGEEARSVEETIKEEEPTAVCKQSVQCKDSEISTVSTESVASEGKAQQQAPDFKFGDSSGGARPVAKRFNSTGKFNRLKTFEIKAKEEKMRAKVQREQTQQLETRATYAALRPADVSSVDWGKAKEINYVHGGSGGILLVHLGDQCVVLKPQGKTAVSEMLAQLVAPICNVRVAQCRCVRHGDDEYNEIMKVHVERDCPVVGGDKRKASIVFGKWIGDDGKVSGDGAPFFGVLEFVPGNPLMGLEAHHMLAAPELHVFVDLGRLCAMDVLLNNMDRVPLPVWSNDGNLGNVMIAASGKNIVGIDQQVNPIRPGPGFELYIDKVKKLYLSALPKGDHSKLVQKLNAALEVNCAVTLKEDGIQLILQGIRECFQAIAEAWRSGAFTKLLDEAATLCKNRFMDEEGKWQDRIYVQDEMNQMLSFLARVAEHISDIVARDPAE